MSNDLTCFMSPPQLSPKQQTDDGTHSSSVLRTSKEHCVNVPGECVLQRVATGSITSHTIPKHLMNDNMECAWCTWRAWPGRCEASLPIALVGAAPNLFLGDSSQTIAKSPMISSDRSDITKSISCMHQTADLPQGNGLQRPLINC